MDVLFAISNRERADLHAVRIVFEELARSDNRQLFKQFSDRLARAAAGEEFSRGALPTAVWQCEVTPIGTLRHSSVRRLDDDGAAALHTIELGLFSGVKLSVLEETVERSAVGVLLTAQTLYHDPFHTAAIKARNMYRILTGQRLG